MWLQPEQFDAVRFFLVVVPVVVVPVVVVPVVVVPVVVVVVVAAAALSLSLPPFASRSLAIFLRSSSPAALT